MTTMKYSQFIAKYRLWITRAIALICIIEFLGHGIPRFLHQRQSRMIFALGAILILLGNFVRSWAAGVLHKRDEVTRTGPYSLCRNPLYLGSALVAIGFGLLLNDPWYWVAITLVGAFIYPITIKHEEINMRARHREVWDLYKKDVGAFYPQSFRFENILSGWSFKRWMTNREYNMLFMSVSALCGLFIWLG